MNYTYKFDKTNIKIGPDGKIEYSPNKDNPGETGFFEINLDFLYMSYQMFPPSIMSSLNKLNKTISKFIYKENQIHTYEKVEGTPGIMPATGNDIYNYVARYGMANFQIQTVMKLNGRLDFDKLLKAVRLTIDAEPVFGCRFIENQPPYWKSLEDADITTLCTFEETGNLDEAVQRFLESPLDMDKDPMIKLKLIRSDSFDTLCLKINHTCCDGTGAKEYLQLISEFYSRIDSNEIFVPEPINRSRKDQDRLFNALEIRDPEAIRNPKQDIPRTLWTFPWRPGKPNDARVAVCNLPKGHINIMSKYAKTRGATINDLLVTAFYRAMFEISQPLYGIPMDISMTVDLRRYLPDKKTEGIRNFSGGFNTRIPRIINEPFEGTLSRVVQMMDKIKTGRPGLQSAIGLEHVEKDDFHQTLSFYRTISQLCKQISGYIPQCAPVFSNLGFLDRSLIKFGENTVTDAYIVPPALCAPGLLLCIGTYNDVLTMSVSYYATQVRRDSIERVLNLIKKELLEGCRL
ncbi:MAG: uncharacterized protein K0R31_1827 [Clostridiales bacterium]|nr:uncharacterized protein [Clostridiales bacterium]